MKLTKRLVGVGAGALAATAMIGGTAGAVFPDYTGCVTAGNIACINIQSRSGYLDIKGFQAPIGESLQISGSFDVNGRFTPKLGTTGVIARPIQVPGGILGIDFPLPGNAVTATAKLAGPTSSLRVDAGNQIVAMPMKLELTNPIIGPGCQIGSNSNPVNVNLIPGTTNPPAPNRPITGSYGRGGLVGTDQIQIFGAVNVDNSFSIPGASNCGIGLGLINSIINLKLKLPSAAGNNTLVIGNDIGIRGIS